MHFLIALLIVGVILYYAFGHNPNHTAEDKFKIIARIVVLIVVSGIAIAYFTGNLY